MFPSEYKRDVTAIGPSGAQMERLTAALERRVAAAERRRGPRVMVAAALCAGLLAVTALAVSPTLREALASALGGFEPFSQEVEGVSAEDQGIRVSVVRTLADESGGAVWLEVRDLTGDRLTEDTWIAGVSTVAYDPEERALLVKCPLTEEMMETGEDGTVSAAISIQEIWGGEWFEGVALPRELLAPDNVLETTTAPEETSQGSLDDRVVLVPEQTPRALEGTDKISLSSMGFDEKGLLHVQLKVAEDFVDQVPKGSYYLDPRELHSYLEEASGRLFSLQGRIHSLEGGRYLDYTVEPIVSWDGEDNIEYLPKEAFRDAPVALSGWIGTRERAEGNWAVTFPLELQPARTVSVGQTVNTKWLEELNLSVMSATLRMNDGETGIRGSLCHLPLTVYRADGTSVTAEWGRNLCGFGEGDTEVLDRWSYPEPVDPAEVAGFSIGRWYIPIEDGAALPGRWLPETAS